MNKKIGFIGAGKMAQAIIKGMLRSNFVPMDNIIASEPNREAALKAAQELGIKVISDNVRLAKDADIIVFAVKPFAVRDVIAQIKENLSKDKLILSILAGVSTELIAELAKLDIPVVRIMPNTPALVNEGMTAVCKGKFAADKDLEFAKKLFECLGKVIVVDEAQIDIVTAISGSSPAFYYYFINEIAKSAEKLGFDYKTALLASAQTALGSAKMVLETGVEPQTLIDNVSTKGGCTEVGINILKDKKLDEIIFETVTGTKEKAAALGK